MPPRRTRLLRNVARACAALLASVAVGGCIAIPIPSLHDPPYEIGWNVILTPGTTTREDVVKDLGEPTVRYCDGHEFVYVAFQQRAVLLIAAGVPSPMVPVGAMSYSRLGKDHVLRAQFDEQGVLREYELNKAKSGWFGDNCTASGVCVLVGMPYRYAPADVDAQAKRFEPVVGRCAVYAYWGSEPISLAVDGKPAAPLVETDGFVWLVLEPGPHTFTAAPSPGRRKYDDWFSANFDEPSGLEKLTGTLEAECEPGSLLFLGEAHSDDEDVGKWYLPGVLDATDARAAITERKLVMVTDPWGEAACGNIRP